MDADLIAIKTALAEISDGELHALIAATYGVPQTAPGLLAWLELPAIGSLTGAQALTTRCSRPRPRSHPRKMRSASARQWRCVRRSVVKLLTGGGRKQ